MITGWVTGVVAELPRVISHGDEAIVTVKLRTTNGVKAAVSVTACARDDEPMEAMALLQVGQVVQAFGVMVLRAWHAKDGKTAIAGLEMVVAKVTTLPKPAAPDPRQVIRELSQRRPPAGRGLGMKE